MHRPKSAPALAVAAAALLLTVHLVALGANYTMDANRTVKTVWDWATPANWTPSTGYPDGATDNATVNFSNSGAIDVDLGGGSYTVDTLTITEGAGSADGDFRNGTLNVNNILYTSGGRTIDFESNLTVNAGSSLLTIEPVQNQWLNFVGPVTGSGGLKFGGNSLTGYTRFYDYQLTGNVELATPSDYAYIDFRGAGGATTTISSLTHADNDAFVIANRSSGSGMYTLEIAGTTTVNSAVTYCKAYTYDGRSQISYEGEINFLRNGYTQLQLNGTGGGVMNVNAGLTTAGPSQTLSLHAGRGTINIDTADPWATRTGQTQIDGGSTGAVNLDAPDVLGSGAIVIRSGGQLRINYDTNALGLPAGGYAFAPETAGWDSGGGALVYTVPQTPHPAVAVSAYNAIGGYVGTDITSASPHIALAEDAVLIELGTNKIVNDDGTPTTLDRTTLGISAPTYWKCVDGYNDSYTVGPQAASPDDPHNIYKGMALGSGRQPVGWDYWRGDLNALPGEKLQIVVGSDTRFQPSGSDRPTLNAYDADHTVDIYGSGYMYVYSSTTLSPIGGNWEVMNRYGQTNSQTFTSITFDRYTNGKTALQADKTVNVWNGRVIFNDSNAIDGTLNIKDGGTLYVNRQLTTGTINVDPGGALWVSSASGLEGLTWGTGLNVAPGALLTPYVDVNTATNANFDRAMRVSDIVLTHGGADYFPGNGIVLGNGRYLMGPNGTNVDLTSSTAGLSADTGATSVGLAAFPGYYLDINCPVNLAGVDLTVGSATNLTTVGTYTNHQRYNLAPTGTVYLDSSATARDLTLESGTLYMRSSTADLRDVTVNGGSLRLYDTTTNVDDVTVNGGNLTIADGSGDTFTATGSLTHNSTGTTNFQNGASWSIAGDMAIHAGRVQFSDLESTVTSKIVAGDVNIHDGAMLYVVANNNAAGQEATLTNAILDGLVASNVVVHDGGQFKYYLSGVALGAGPYFVDQAFTVTGDAANSPNDSQIYHDIEGGGGRFVHYNSLTLGNNAIFGMNAADGAGFAALKLAGDARISQDGSADNFGLEGVTSLGAPRTLTIGRNDPFTTSLTGISDGGTTLDLANASLTLDVAGGGQIDGSAIVRSGSSLLIPSGTTTIGKDLTVLDGSTVTFTGADVTIGGILSGDGTITGPVTAGGTCAPGTSPGILTVDGDFTFDPGSRFAVQLGGTTPGNGDLYHDLLDVLGDASLGQGTAFLDVELWASFVPQIADSFTILTATSVTGTFAGLPDGAYLHVDGSPYPLAVHYYDTSVVLGAVPEPATTALLGAGLLALLRRRKSRAAAAAPSPAHGGHDACGTPAGDR